MQPTAFCSYSFYTMERVSLGGGSIWYLGLGEKCVPAEEQSCGSGNGKEGLNTDHLWDFWQKLFQFLSSLFH